MTLSRPSLREQIREVIVGRILDGTYAPGDRIVEIQVAHEFGTSQAPVREALRELESMRLVVSEPHRGARVRDVTDKDLAEIYPVRAALEELAGQLATVRDDGTLVDALRMELAEMRSCARAADVHGQLTHDARFHGLIVEAARNAVLLEAWQSLRIEARTLITVVRFTADLLAVADTHQPIIDAFVQGDPQLVGKELRVHIEYFLQNFRDGTQAPSPNGTL